MVMRHLRRWFGLKRTDNAERESQKAREAFLGLYELYKENGWLRDNSFGMSVITTDIISPLGVRVFLSQEEFVKEHWRATR